MSAKATGLVWDMECPTVFNGLTFESHHKFVLIAYADHADHTGRNIYPAVETVRKKIGKKSPRSVQSATRQLETMGILIADGQGPRGTRKWRIPFNGDATAIAPLQILQGAISSKSLGATRLGATPLGAVATAPELKEPELVNLYISNIDSSIWDAAKEKIKPRLNQAAFNTWVAPTEAITWEGQYLIVAAHNDKAKTWLGQNLTAIAQQELGQYVKFITYAQVGDE